jgi:tRNA-splicing ligase RtcB (3'-phosphate/5'-hydroxy nucleic acid ligase)
MDTARLSRISEVEWQIPPTGKMRVPGTIFADEALIRAMDDKVREQVSNVATLPGIVRASFALPDAHWGYGFPIGGVAAFDPDAGGVVSAGGVGFDISCGVRTLLTGVARAAVEPVKERLADALYRAVPAGLGSKGKIRLNDHEMGAMLEGAPAGRLSAGLASLPTLPASRRVAARPMPARRSSRPRRGSASTPRWARSARATTTSRCRKSWRSALRRWPRACFWARW